MMLMTIFLGLTFQNMLPPAFALLTAVPFTMGWIGQVVAWFLLEGQVENGRMKAWYGIPLVFVLLVYITFLFVALPSRPKEQMPDISSPDMIGVAV